MSIVTIILNNKNFQLYCNDGEEEELLILADTLNKKIFEIKNASPTASSELLLVMIALSLQAELKNLLKKINDMDYSKVHNNNQEFSETLSTIAGYLENLAKKIGK